MTNPNRRDFLGFAGATVAGSVLTSGAIGAVAPNDAVNVGMIGVGNRGSVLLKNLLEVPGVNVRAICDIDPGHAEAAV